MAMANAYYVYCLERDDKVCHLIGTEKEMDNLDAERFITVNGKKLSSIDRDYIISWIHSHYEPESIDKRTINENHTELAGIKRKVKSMEDLKW